MRLRRNSYLAGTIFAFCVLLATQTFAQSPVASEQRGFKFDAASVRIDNEVTIPRVHKAIEGGPGTSDPGRVNFWQMPMLGLITQAYGVPGDQIFGYTESMTGTRYTIAATFPPTTTKEQFQTMLQNMLAERFHLSSHHETKDFPGYALTVVAGKQKFQRWPPDPSAPPTAQGQPLQTGQSGYYVSTQRDPPVVRVTNRQSMSEFATDLRDLQIMSDNVLPDTDRNDRLEAQLAGGRTVQMARFVDQTGLIGAYEFNLEFEGSPIPGFIFTDSNRPTPKGGSTLAEALDKQLGLKLVKIKNLPVDVIVIDHVDKVPTEN